MSEKAGNQKLFTRKTKSSEPVQVGEAPLHVPSSQPGPTKPPTSATRLFLNRTFLVLITANIVVGGYMLFGGNTRKEKAVDVITEDEENDDARDGSGHHSQLHHHHHRHEHNHNNNESGGRNETGNQIQSKDSLMPSSPGSVTTVISSAAIDSPSGEISQSTSSAREETFRASESTSEAVQLPRVQPTPSKEEQLEVMKWILENRRRAKPKSREERRQVDQDKKLLKDWIRAQRCLINTSL